MYRLLDQGFAASILALMREQNSEEMKRIDVVAITVENLAVDWLRLGEPSGSVVLSRQGELLSYRGYRGLSFHGHPYPRTSLSRVPPRGSSDRRVPSPDVNS